MESSSDDSFAWQTASRDSTDSDMQNCSDKEQLNNSQLLSKKNSTSDPNRKKSKPDLDIDSPKNKKIKIEHESDDTQYSKKKKKPHPELNHSYLKEEMKSTHKKTKKKSKPRNDSECEDSFKTEKNQPNGFDENSDSHIESDSIEDKYLSKKVKQENALRTTTPRDAEAEKMVDKHHCSSSDDQSDNIYDEEHLNKKIKEEKRTPPVKIRQRRDADANMSHSSDTQDEIQKRPNKKLKATKKRKEDKYENSSNSDNIEEPSVHTPTDLENAYKKRKKRKRQVSDRPDITNRKASLTVTTSENDENGEDLKLSQSTDFETKPTKSKHNPTSAKSHNFANNETIIDTPTRMPDRIAFEEDSDDVDKESPPQTGDRRSLRLQQFLKANPTLSLITQNAPSAPTIADEEEVWVLKCPQEMNVSTLNDQEIHLASQFKIKVDGSSYYGTMQKDTNQIAVMTYKDNRFVVKKLLLNGLIHFRKRIPKLHIQDDGAAQSQAPFIPLPETKCRHPLFGSNYKKVMKIPKQVAQRLQNTSIDSLLPSKEKKKKKYDKEIKKEEPMETDAGAVDKSIKRKRKHHADDSECLPKKAKRRHQNPDSAEFWESEKKIEENLFNF